MSVSANPAIFHSSLHRAAAYYSCIIIYNIRSTLYISFKISFIYFPTTTLGVQFFKNPFGKSTTEAKTITPLTWLLTCSCCLLTQMPSFRALVWLRRVRRKGFLCLHFAKDQRKKVMFFSYLCLCVGFAWRAWAIRSFYTWGSDLSTTGS